jgi:hypothetical protein
MEQRVVCATAYRGADHLCRTKPNAMFPNVRSSENLHIVLWLLKDLCWVLDLKVAGLVMIVPTVGMALYITWLCRHDLGELLHCMAVVLWIMANGTWMIGEFFFEDGTRPLAVVFFGAGLLTVSWYYAVMLPRRARVRRATGNAR